MRKERIQTVTGDALLKMDLPPLRYAVHGFLPQGLHILAGLPKAGKSWLLHQLGLKVSEGENFWNFTTEKGTVLELQKDNPGDAVCDALEKQAKLYDAALSAIRSA